MRCKSYSRTCLILNSPQNRLGCRFYLPYEMCKEQCGLRMNRSFRGGAIGFTNALIFPHPPAAPPIFWLPCFPLYEIRPCCLILDALRILKEQTLS